MQCKALMSSSTVLMSQAPTNTGPRHKLFSGSRKLQWAVMHVCVCALLCAYLYVTLLENGILTLLLAWHMRMLDLLQISPSPGVLFAVNLNNNKHACQILLWSLAASWAALCRTSFVPVTSFLCSREAFTTRSTSRAGARRIHLLCLLTDQISPHRSRNP